MDESKLNSRKFIVWLVWLIISALTLVIGLVILIITKTFPSTFIEILKLVLEYFFTISCVYLGVNGIQKVGFAISDAITGSSETTEEEK